jgi:hypothetical protein
MDVLSVFVQEKVITSSSPPPPPPPPPTTHHPHPDPNPNNTPDVPTSQHVPPCRYCNALDIFLDVCFVSKQGVANQDLFIVVALNSVCTCLSTTQAKCFSLAVHPQAGRQAQLLFCFAPFKILVSGSCWPQGAECSQTGKVITHCKKASCCLTGCQDTMHLLQCLLPQIICLPAMPCHAMPPPTSADLFYENR